MLDFGNGLNDKKSDEVFFQINNGILTGSVNQGGFISSPISTKAPVIQFKSWYHVAFVVKNTTGYLYLNGAQVANGLIPSPNGIIRSTNIIGKCYSGLQLNLNNLKIFEGSLQPEEVLSDYSPGYLSSCCTKNFYFILTFFFSFKATLINYWPISNLSDVISKADIVNGSNYFTDLDRFSNPSSAIYLNNGYLTLPPGIYFEGDFSTSLWIKFKSFQDGIEIYDFGNGAGNELVLKNLVNDKILIVIL